MHIKTALYGFVVNFAIRHYKVPFKTLVDPFLGYLVVGRASPHLPLSSSTRAYFEEHPEDHPVTIFIYLLQQVVIWNLILHFLDVRSIISQCWNINSSQHVVDCWVLERNETHMTKLQSRLDLWIKEKTLVVHGNVWAEAGQLYYSQVSASPPWEMYTTSPVPASSRPPASSVVRVVHDVLKTVICLKLTTFIIEGKPTGV